MTFIPAEGLRAAAPRQNFEILHEPEIEYLQGVR